MVGVPLAAEDAAPFGWMQAQMRAEIENAMDARERKKVSVITKYVLECFSESDWYTLGQLTGSLETVQSHGRLLRSLSFRDDDYPLYWTQETGPRL